MPEASDSLPTAVLTGFLGSGKSTLLNGLLPHGDMADTAVIVNELGEVGIDNLLIERVTEGVTLLTSGCLCCAVRSDLEATLRDLYLKRARSVIPAFKRVVIETTGMALPGPILQTLLSRPVRELHYEVTTVITTVDATQGSHALGRYIEASQQVAVADRLILTKCDLAPAEQCAGVESLLREQNPLAPIVRVTLGKADPLAVFGPTFLTGMLDVAGYRQWALVGHAPADQVSVDHASADQAPLGHAPADQAPAGHASADQAPAGHALGGSQRPGATAHSSGIRTRSFTIEQIIDWDVLERALRTLLDRHGERVLRFKAILSIRGLDERVALHGVHHTLYPPELFAAASERTLSRLVFISQDVDDGVFDEFVAQVVAQSADLTSTEARRQSESRHPR